jgi:ABC-2 type transport system ATP-binding protein
MLDEPTSALDPLGRKEVLDMVASLRGRTTVFFSTHILGDVERVCDTVAVLEAGRVVAQAPIDELKARYSARRIEVQVDRDAAALADAFRDLPWCASAEVDEDTVSLSVVDLEPAQFAIPRVVAERGLALRRLEGGEVSLEDVFVELVGEARSR